MLGFLVMSALLSPFQLESLDALSPQQTAELLLLPLPFRNDTIHRVFDFLIESPENRRLPDVLHYLVKMAPKVAIFSVTNVHQEGLCLIAVFSRFPLTNS